MHVLVGCMSFKQFVKELNGERPEGKLVKTILYSLLTSFTVLGVLYFFRLQYISDFIPNYGFYLFFSTISYALIIAAFKQVIEYREMACMPGMMVGMTIGMISGFLPGFYIASTNGMFVGSVFGGSIGIILGTWAGGRSCGIMGFMEGIMAGFMGGLMGAMTAFMLLNDHLKAASVLVFLVSAAILIGLNYMVYKEMKNEERKAKDSNSLTLALTFVLIFATVWLMIYGPRSLLFT